MPGTVLRASQASMPVASTCYVLGNVPARRIWGERGKCCPVCRELPASNRAYWMMKRRLVRSNACTPESRKFIKIYILGSQRSQVEEVFYQYHSANNMEERWSGGKSKSRKTIGKLLQ